MKKALAEAPCDSSVVAADELELALLAGWLAVPSAGAAGGRSARSSLSEAEAALVGQASHRAAMPLAPNVEALAMAIVAGQDPLGETLCRLRSVQERRRDGAVYTPAPIVRGMVDWAAKQGTPARVVDPGAGSGRFLLAAGLRFPQARLVAVELDALSALVLRANAQAMGMTERLDVLVQDYRGLNLPAADGPTLFLGNPPYVRHHAIAPKWKEWFAEVAGAYSVKASRLAGSHVHFLLKTACLAKTGDFGAFITSAEWLDVNYGALPRKLFTDVLGGTAIAVFAPDASPFPDADSTGAVFCFRVSGPGTGDGRTNGASGREDALVRLRQVEALEELDGLDCAEPSAGKREAQRLAFEQPPCMTVRRSRLRRSKRWSSFLRPESSAPADFIELGELCRVHRGQVTGCNAAWIAGRYSGELPERCLLPAVTKARELFNAGERLVGLENLRRVIDLPVELDALDAAARRQAEGFLIWARKLGADSSYVAKHRRAWWAVQLRQPAPILCTYMARRPPAFVRNPPGARHLNIAHGIYPREALSSKTLDALADWLRCHVETTSGRTYAGGLTKFEPKEIERLLVPPLARFQ